MSVFSLCKISALVNLILALKCTAQPTKDHLKKWRGPIVQTVFVEGKRWSVHPPWCWPNDQCHDHLVFPCLLTLRWNCGPGEESKITMMMLGARYDHYWSLLVQGTMIMITTFGLWSWWRVSDNNDIAVCKVYFLSLSSLILVQGIFFYHCYHYSWCKVFYLFYHYSWCRYFFIFIIIILGARYG